MCKPHNSNCFSDDENKVLNNKDWTKEQIDFVEDSIVEDKIKELIK